jgi:prepilin-type N-terminal cleavage/methylation domain-containing protein
VPADAGHAFVNKQFSVWEGFMSYVSASRRAFSLIELVIVVVIIGIIAAIAVPRMSRGAQGAGDSALISNLQVLRNAIDLYQTEHGGNYPGTSKIAAQLTTYTDDNGNQNATKTNEFYLGPYLRAVPPLPVGSNKGNSGISTTTGTGVGWIYDGTTIKANLPDGEVDSKGNDWNDY